jgi:hypothetical protein
VAGPGEGKSVVLRLESQVTVEGLTGQDVMDVLVHPTDDHYRAWWPGTHLELHVLEHGSGMGPVGDLVLMDEYIGSRRVRMVAEVIEAVPGERMVWQLRRFGVRLPIRVTVALRAVSTGILVRHTLTVGWPRRGRLLDPLWRLYFSRSFARALDRHVHTEFPLLRALPRTARPSAPNMPEASPTSAADLVRDVP